MGKVDVRLGQRHAGLCELAGGLDLHVDAPLQARHGWRTRWPLGLVDEVEAAIAAAGGLVVVAPGVKPSVSFGHGCELGHQARVSMVLGGREGEREN
jgi:hypothetical protein